MTERKLDPPRHPRNLMTIALPPRALRDLRRIARDLDQLPEHVLLAAAIEGLCAWRRDGQRASEVAA